MPQRPDMFRKIFPILFMILPVLTAGAHMVTAEENLGDAQGAVEEAALHAPEAREAYRLRHARELLGQRYDSSVVKVGEQVPDMKLFVQKATASKLASRWQRKAD